MSNPSPGRPPAPAARQGDLFESLGPAIDAGFTTARRIELDATSWIEHVPGWLRASGALFDELMATAPWEQRYRYMYDRRVIEPRLTAEYRDISDAPQQLLHSVTAVLARHYGVAYRYVWLNLYRTHRDSTSWHGDPIGKVQPTSTVPVLSLGATRRFLIKPGHSIPDMEDVVVEREHWAVVRKHDEVAHVVET